MKEFKMMVYWVQVDRESTYYPTDEEAQAAFDSARRSKLYSRISAFSMEARITAEILASLLNKTFDNFHLENHLTTYRFLHYQAE